MRYTVYADVLFLINWLLDCVLVRAAAAVLNVHIRYRRIAAAAAAGALWVCLAAAFPFGGAAEWLISLFAVSALMVVIAFRPRSPREFVSRMAALYAVAFLGGGLISAVWFHTPAGAYLRDLAVGKRTLSAPTAALVPAAAAGIAASAWGLGRTIRAGRRRANRFAVTLYLDGTGVELFALLDTGNRLREPVTGEPVHLAQASALKPFALEMRMTGRFLVPYRAVGTEHGLLTAVRFDRMELRSEAGKKAVCERPLIGLYEGNLSANEEYQLILHADTETGVVSSDL